LSLLAEQIVEAATQVLADRDRAPRTAKVLHSYQTDGMAVAVAVLIRLAGRKGYSGLDKGHSACAAEILRLANEIDGARPVDDEC
jgi:hypothetical protein